MDYFNLVMDIILFLVSICTWLSYMLIILILLQKVTVRSTDLFQYKLINKYLSIIFASSYIIVFIIILYSLRIYNMHHKLDLKEVFKNIKYLYYMFTPVDLFILALFLLLSLSLGLVFVLILHRFFLKHMFMLYIYYVCSYDKYISRIKSRTKLHKFYNLLFDINDLDIITYIIYRFSYKLIPIIYGINFDIRRLSKYHPQRLLGRLIYGPIRNKYKLLIMLSPIIIIIYDCIFYNWVLMHVSYYLLLYIPLMIFRRITTFIGTDPGYILSIIWNIYYKDEKICIYAVSKKELIIINSYLLSGLRSTPDLLDLQLSNVLFSLYHTIKYELYSIDRNTYRNSEGISIQKTSDNKLYLEIEIEDEEGNIIYTLGEEWILLVDKTL